MMSDEKPNHPLADRLVEAPVIYDGEQAARLRADLVSEIADPALKARLARRLSEPQVSALVEGILGCSPYLTGLVRRDPVRLLRLLEAVPEAHMTALLSKLAEEMSTASNIANAMPILRRFKSETALLLGLADLGGVWPVMQITAALTAAADAAVATSIRFLFAQASQRGEWLPLDPAQPEQGSGYVVLAMGKHGAGELNYSSDIDLIVFFDAERARLRPGLEAPAFFIRMTRDLVKLMQ